MNHSADYSELNLFYKEELVKLIAARKAGMRKDSIHLYEERIHIKADNVLKRIKEKESKKKPLAMPTYNFITILKIDNDKSLYYPQEKVSNDTISETNTNEKGKEFTRERIHYNNSEVVYTNQSERKKISFLKVYEFDLRGRKFLIEEELEQQQWRLTKETKKIDQYTCYKSILKNSNKKVEAWYTNSIKSMHGPKDYHGFPGLILELKKGEKRVSFLQKSFTS